MTLLQAAIAVLNEGQAILHDRGYVAVPRSAIVALTEAVCVAMDQAPGFGLSAVDPLRADEALFARFAMVADALEGPSG